MRNHEDDWLYQHHGKFYEGIYPECAITSFVASGAVAALGFDYYQVGVQTADYVEAVLQGKKISEIPVSFAKGSDLFLNLKAAEALGISLPDAMVKRATNLKK